MKLPCWIRGHKWFILSWFNYMDTSYSESGSPSNNITFICNVCKKTRVQRNFGGGHMNEEYLKHIGIKFYEESKDNTERD